jgi:hypothetical protein
MKNTILTSIGLLVLLFSQILSAQNPIVPKNKDVTQKPMFPHHQNPNYEKEGNGILSVTTKSIGIILTTSASCYFSVSGSPVSESGVCWSTSHNPTLSNSKNNKPSGNQQQLSVLMTNLKPNTTYYVRAFAQNGDKLIYGNELTFKTKSEEENKNPKVEPKKEPKEENPKK